MTPPLITMLLTITLVTAVWWSVPVFTRATLPFGVRVPPDRVTDPAVERTRQDFTRRVAAAAVIAAVVCLPLTLVTSTALVLPGATGVLTVVGASAYIVAHQRLRAAKRDGAWYSGTRQGVTADLSFRTDPVRAPWWWLLPSVAVLAVTATTGIVLFGRLSSTLPAMDGVDLSQGDRVATTFLTAFTPVLTQAGLCLATAGAVVGLLRTRPDLDASRPAASARRYRHYLRALARLLFLVTALANLTMLGIALRLWEQVPASVTTTIMVFAPLAATVPAIVVFQLRVGQAGDRLTDQPGEADEDTGLVQRDDDRHWYLGGFVYGNPDDPALFVHQRVGGARWTVNLGRPAGRVIVTVVVVAATTVTILSGLGAIDLPSK